MNRTGTAALLTIPLVLLGCSKKPGSTSTPEAPSATGPAPSAAEAPMPSSAGSTPSATGIVASLAERLSSEAQHRPHIQPNADDILAAFTKVGGGITAKKQGLAATYKASFCEGATTDDGSLTIGVCEYADDDSAKAGLAAVQSIFPAKQARHVLHKDTVLTTVRLKDGAAAQALETKMIDAYNAL
jgi:hypothetical protein